MTQHVGSKHVRGGDGGGGGIGGRGFGANAIPIRSYDSMSCFYQYSAAVAYQRRSARQRLIITRCSLHTTTLRGGHQLAIDSLLTTGPVTYDVLKSGDLCVRFCF